MEEREDEAGTWLTSIVTTRGVLEGRRASGGKRAREEEGDVSAAVSEHASVRGVKVKELISATS